LRATRKDGYELWYCLWQTVSPRRISEGDDAKMSGVKNLFEIADSLNDIADKIEKYEETNQTPNQLRKLSKRLKVLMGVWQ